MVKPLAVVPEFEPKLDPHDFVTMMFVEISGLLEHRIRYEKNPDEKIRTRAYTHFTAKIKQTTWIIGEYTGWGEIRTYSEYEKWSKEISSP